MSQIQFYEKNVLKYGCPGTGADVQQQAPLCLAVPVPMKPHHSHYSCLRLSCQPDTGQGVNLHSPSGP